MVIKKIFLIILPFILLEFFLRIVGLDVYKFRGYPNNYFIHDEVNGYDIKKNIKKNFFFNELPHEIIGNNIGCNDENVNKDIKDYVLVIGDSVSWGFVPFKNTWGHNLEKQINKQVIQCGVPGYGTKQEINKLKKVLNLLDNKPDLLIFQYTFTNDLLNDYLFPQYRIQNGFLITNKHLDSFKEGKIKINNQSKSFKKLKLMLNEYSYTFRLLHKTQSMIKILLKKKDKKETVVPFEPKKYNNFNYPPFYFSYIDDKKFTWLENAWDKHLQNILTIKRITDEKNINLLFLFYGTMPDYARLYFKDAKKRGIKLKLENELKVLSFLTNNNINFINISEHMWDYAGYKTIYDKEKLSDGDMGDELKDLIWYTDRSHPNIEGNKFFSEKLINKIIQDDLLNNLN